MSNLKTRVPDFQKAASTLMKPDLDFHEMEPPVKTLVMNHRRTFAEKQKLTAHLHIGKACNVSGVLRSSFGNSKSLFGESKHVFGASLSLYGDILNDIGVAISLSGDACNVVPAAA